MGHKRVLLVEDNRLDEELTTRALKRSGISLNVTVAHDGVEALDLLYASDAGSLPDLILLDLKLPRLSGLDVLARLRSKPLARIVPVVVLSSSTKPEDVEIAYRLGCHSYVAKGIDFLRFVDAAQLMVRYWLALNVAPREELERE
jgi:two-component system, response regulator